LEVLHTGAQDNVSVLRVVVLIAIPRASVVVPVCNEKSGTTAPLAPATSSVAVPTEGLSARMHWTTHVPPSTESVVITMSFALTMKLPAGRVFSRMGVGDSKVPLVKFTKPA
jgi:hypothetical protein